MNYLLVSNDSEIKELLKELLPMEHHPMELDGKMGEMVVNQSDVHELGSRLTDFFKKFKNLKNVELNLIGHTKYEGIDELYITRGKTKKVIVKTWNGGSGSETAFKEVTEAILSPIIKSTIYMYVPHGTAHEGYKKGFNIFIWSSQIRDKIKCPNKIWGYKVSCTDDSFSPAYKGEVICDDSYVVAELIDNNLYIHHDICHHNTVEELSIYKRVLVEVADILSTSPEEREAMLVKNLEKTRERYIELCQNRIKSEQKKIQNKLSSAMGNIEENKKTIINDIRKYQEYEFLLNNYKIALKDKQEEFGKEFDKLLSMDKVITVDINSREVEVFTDTLYCEDPRTGKIHEIGKFRISIPIGRGVIKWNNLTRKVYGCDEGMHAPHVFKSGKACLGNAEQVIPELVANYQFSIIAMYAIQFIESVNVDDSAGQYINKWPIAKI